MTRAKKKLPRGIDELPSGALRVRVYSGVDPVTGRPHYLTEIIPHGPKVEREAVAARERLSSEVRERRNPRTNATVNQLLERYLDAFDGAPSTKKMYRGYVRMHVAPFIGEVKVGTLDVETLDSLYIELRRCREHCDGKPRFDHRADAEHVCDKRCGPHKCKPLGATTIRHIHYILSGAYKRAKRWKWVTASPVGDAEPPAAPVPKPAPPSAEDAARIVTEAWRDPDWGVLVWTAMTVGARRGELCALRWSDLNLDPEHAVASVSRAISRDEDGNWVEANTKTPEHRRVALDPETVKMLTEHRDRCRDRLAALESKLAPDAFLFSSAIDGSRFAVPDSVSQRFDRMAKRLGIDTTLHKVRHYSATELISAGVDVRTVAGRLGHAGGGTTTLRTYAAWVSEADQRAATSLAGRMPSHPAVIDPVERAKTDPQSPYGKIAAQIRHDIINGTLPDGSPAPSLKEITREHDVSTGTAHRVLTLLKTWGVIEGDYGKRAIVVRPVEPEPDDEPEPPRVEQGSTLLSLRLLCLGEEARTFTAKADPADPDELHGLLAGAARRHGGKNADMADYELEVRLPDSPDPITTFAAL